MKNNIPMRKCIGCNVSKPQKDLIRISCYQGKLTIDKGKKSNGRGVYLCKGSLECINKAEKRKALSRNFATIDDNQIQTIFEQLKAK